MGKPFKKELESIDQVYNWARDLDISELKNEIEKLKKNPLLAIGSGGSLSACYFASKLHQTNGQIGKAITPLELFYSKNIISNCSLLFLSSSGRNIDILTSFKNSNIENPKKMLGVTLSLNTPLKKVSSLSAHGSIIEFKNPIGKDGFLATNSLIAFFILLHRAYGHCMNDRPLIIEKSFYLYLEKFISKVNENFTFKILYADWSLPVAIDIESKFSEAALGNVLLADYRNFGHGRHNWIDKRKENTAIVALITPDDKDLAEKTLALLPENIPIYRIETDNNSSLGAIELLIKSFYLTDSMGEIQNIDPGRPGVPQYGSKLYHLNYSKLLKKQVNNSSIIAIQRKLGKQSFYGISDEEQMKWMESFNQYKKKLNQEKFKAIVFDYDGTLCHAIDRYIGLNEEMGEILNNLLANNIAIGIASGRGKSIKKDLRRVIEEKYWNRVIIGYYNGGEIGYLSEDSIPNKNIDVDENLIFLHSNLKEKYKDEIGFKLKTKQLTLELRSNHSEEYILEVIQYINLQNKIGILCVQSDHSIDIVLRPDVSKLNVLQYIQKKINISDYQILTLGDKGKYPGNDFELLSHPFSLSVDEVSIDKDSCWNFSNSGSSNVDATFFYLNKIKPFNDYFKLAL